MKRGLPTESSYFKLFSAKQPFGLLAMRAAQLPELDTARLGDGLQVCHELHQRLDWPPPEKSLRSQRRSCAGREFWKNGQLRSTYRLATWQSVEKMGGLVYAHMTRRGDFFEFK